MGASEQKFKVGDRVRSVSGDEGYDGATGVVVLNDGSFWRPLKIQLDAPIKQWGDTYIWRGHDEVEAENTWQPKIGDRVRFTDAVPSHWFFGPTTANKEGVIKSDSGDAGMRYAVSIGDEFGFVDIEHIEPLPVAEQPAALKIEAGKFYRTRDGRKVGPMRPIKFGDLQGDCQGLKTAFVAEDLASNGTGGCYTKEGLWLTGNGSYPHDLIAEWVDEPAAQTAATVAATASNDNAAPAKFKVGDVVRLKSDGFAADVGATANIRELRSDGMIDLEWVRNSLRHGQSDGGYYPDSFELANTQPTAIVAFIEDDQPLPATRPHVHADVAAATKEAERLAGLHRGQRFGVYVLHDTRETDQPDYGHEWKNLAARGQKIAAIKELRSLTGLNLAAAKAAVEKWAEYELAA